MSDKNMEAEIFVQFTEATSRQSLNTGESITTLWGKAKKWLSDLKSVAFSGSFNDLSDVPTSFPANGGNADTLGNKHASDFMQNLGYLTTGSLLDYVLTMTSSGSFFISSSVTDTPVSGLFYGVDVIRHTGGDYVITATRFNGGGVWTNRYNSGAKKWYGWANVADGGNADTVNGHTVYSDVPENAKFTDTTYPAASVSAAGLVTTGSQTFAGYKTFQNNVYIQHSKYTKSSTAPSTIQFKAYRFSDNANKQMGEFSNYVDTNNNTVSKMLAVAATSLDGKIYSQIATLINADGTSCRHVCTTPAVGASSLRQMASGTAAANTSNCPDGAWYGQYEEV